MYSNRQSRLWKQLSALAVEGFLVTSYYNRLYLSGFQGTSGWLLITEEQVFLITDFRYIAQAKSEAKNCEMVIHTGNLLAALKDLLSQRDIHELGFEAEYLTYDQYQKFSLGLTGVDLIPVESAVETMRVKKEPFEIERIKKAVQIADDAFAHILGYIKPGITENDLAAEIEYYMRRQGARKPSFDTIVASGFRGALPHGIASSRRIENGDLVVIDFGALCDGYCSDMTRTIVAGKASREQKRIYDIVLEAQLRALEFVGAGKKCSEVDAVAREIISGHGLGEKFGHGLGHGVGLEVHEKPALNIINHTELAEGMVVTVEPGIYLEDWGGVRIEDMVVVTDQGCQVLTKSGKELIEVY